MNRTVPKENMQLPFCLELVESIESVDEVALLDVDNVSATIHAILSAFSAAEQVSLIYCDPSRSLSYGCFDYFSGRAALLKSYSDRLQQKLWAIQKGPDVKSTFCGGKSLPPEASPVRARSGPSI